MINVYYNSDPMINLKSVLENAITEYNGALSAISSLSVPSFSMSGFLKGTLPDSVNNFKNYTDIDISWIDKANASFDSFNNESISVISKIDVPSGFTKSHKIKSN